MKSNINRTIVALIGVSAITLGSAATLPKTNFYPLGLYGGMQLGSSETHYGLSGFNNTNNNTEVNNGTVTSSGFGERILLGYRFMQYFAAEAGYTNYGTATGGNLTYTNGTNADGKIKEQSFDLYAKGILPIAQEVDLYAKAGMGVISSKTTTTAGFSKSRSVTRPGLAGGASYNITKNFAADVSYNRIVGSGKVKSADLFALGFYYYLG